MKPWTLLLGLFLACAACCAMPLMGVAAALLAAGAASLFFVPAATLALVALALLVGDLIWHRRRRQLHANCAAKACNCSGSCAP